jgi:thioredoxin reductase (NADPH)
MRAVNQAWLFGVSFMLGAADGLTADGAAHVVHAGSGQVEARAVVIGAAAAEARAMAGQDVYVIGAGNSAGQAAIHLSKYAASVTMLVRGPGLAASMSSYLVTEISKTANIRVRPSTEVTGGHGRCSLENLTLRHRISGATETVPAAALFVMIGAEPRTSWLPASIERNDEGFIRTGRDLHRLGELPAGWPLKRPPLLLETSIPGVFDTGTSGTGPSSGRLGRRRRRHRHPARARIPAGRAGLTAGPSGRSGRGVLLRCQRGDELGPGVDVELAVDLAQVELDRLGRQEQVSRDVAV